MKRLAFLVLTVLSLVPVWAAGPRAIYVKESDGYHKYSFGVAGDLKFSEDGKTLYVSGYDTGIKLANVEHISFDMPVGGQMSSTEHKDRILQIGDELYPKINVNDAADVLGFMAEYTNLSFCDQDEIFADFKANHPDLFDDDEEYDYRAPLNKLINAMGDMAKGNFAAVRAMGSVYTDLFTKNDLTGVFEADVNQRKWTKISDANYFELRFKGPAMGKNYTFRIEASEDYTQWAESIKLKDYDGSILTYNVTGRVPRHISCVTKMQNTVIFNTDIDFELNQENKSLDMTLAADFANIKVDNVLAIRNTSANDDLTVAIKGEKVITNTVRLKGSELLNMQGWADDMQGVLDEYEYENYGEYYYTVDGRSVVRKFGSVVTDTDILGQLQVKGHVANYDNSYDDIERYLQENDEAFSVEINRNKNLLTLTYGSEQSMNKIVEIFNNYSDASFYYDHGYQPQGFVIWNVDEDIWDDGYTVTGYWDERTNTWVDLGASYQQRDIEYITLPYLTFADGSSFAFDSKYFTGNNFRKFVNDADDIVNTINNILSDYEYDEPYPW